MVQRYNKDRCPTCGQMAKFYRPEFLRARRRENNLTLMDIAKRIGISIAYLSDMEHGKRRVRPEFLYAYGIGTQSPNNHQIARK